MNRVLAAAMAALFLAAVSTAPTAAQPGTSTPAKPAAKPPAKPAATPAEPKKLTVQQQKMKDCAAKWGDHKKATGEKGRDAYRKYMSGCLKGTST